MKVKIERQLFGALLENDIKTAIDSTSLKDSTIHNLVLKIGHSWRQYDHLIILPHRIVPIEAKSTSMNRYRVTEWLDYFFSGEEEVSYNTSIVQQVQRGVSVLNDLLNYHLLQYQSTITPIGCIRAPDVKSEQTILPIYKDTDLWYFLKSIEAESSLYSKEHKEEVLNSARKQLNPYRKSNEDYLVHLKSQGVDIHKIMRIEEDRLVPTKLVFLEDENIIKSNQNKTTERLSKLEYLLRRTLDTVPDDAYNYALKYSTVPINQVYEVLVVLEELSKDYQHIKHIFNKNSHLINSNYILYHCKENNIFFYEYMLAVLKVYKEKYPNSYTSLQEGVEETEIYNLDLERILLDLKRGRC